MQIDKIDYSKERPSFDEENKGARAVFDLALPRGRDVSCVDHIVDVENALNSSSTMWWS